MFGKEAALFCPSGTMTNQIAIKCHTSPGDECICSSTAHVFLYEGGGMAFNSGVQVPEITSLHSTRCQASNNRTVSSLPRLHFIHTTAITQARVVQGDDRGRIDAAGITAAVNADDPHYPISRLVCIEVCDEGWRIGFLTHPALCMRYPADPDLDPSGKKLP